jgi:tetratricopeptide (TPR) repeat protein
MTLNNLGAYYSANQKMSQAEVAYNEALKIYRQLAEKSPDAFLPVVAKILNNLGVFYKTLKQYDKALEHYGEALCYHEGTILKGGTNFINDWIQMLLNIAGVKDSAEVKKDYAGMANAVRLLAEGCDNLKGVNKKLLPLAVSQYGILSWWALFAKDYALSEKAARRCLELDETQAYVLTNLGHSQILRGQYNAGMATYEKLKGKKDGEGKDYKQVLLNDLKALEAEGITHKDFVQARAAIEKW